MRSPSPPVPTSPFHAFKVSSIDGSCISLNAYSGQVVLLVNVASQCIFTSQYTALEALYRQYRDAGFVVLGFPCNQFAHQEPHSNQDVYAFCTQRYDVTFPLFSKIDVNGPHADPLFRWLTSTSPGILNTQSIKWNFTKFLLDRRGFPIKRFAPSTSVRHLESVISHYLKKYPSI